MQSRRVPGSSFYLPLVLLVACLMGNQSRAQCSGTESVDDITQSVTVNGIPPATVTTVSPGGTLVGRPLLVVAEILATGSPHPNPFPGICVSGSESTFLVASAPFGGDLVLVPGGFSYVFPAPVALTGTSMLAQSIVLGPMPLTANGIFASTHATEIVFP